MHIVGEIITQSMVQLIRETFLQSSINQGRRCLHIRQQERRPLLRKIIPHKEYVRLETNEEPAESHRSAIVYLSHLMPLRAVIDFVILAIILDRCMHFDHLIQLSWHLTLVCSLRRGNSLGGGGMSDSKRHARVGWCRTWMG